MKSLKTYLKAQLIIVLFCSMAFLSTAQEESRSVIISGVPQYVINRGLRIDFEKKLPMNRQWLILSPQYYMGWVDRTSDNFQTQNPTTDGDSLFGFGLDISHKIFLVQRDLPKGGYFSYGLSFNHFTLGYKEFSWVEVKENGLVFQVNKLTEFKDVINKFGFNTTIGIQGILVDYIIYDLYIGLGARYSFIQQGLPGSRDYNQYYWDYGYSGPLLLLGARIGVLLF